MSESVVGTRSIEAMLAEIAASKNSNDAGKTVNEISADTGISPKRVQKLLQLAMAHGRLVVGSKVIQRIDGRSQKVPVYGIRPKAKK